MTGEPYGGSTLALYQSTKRVRATRIGAFMHQPEGWVAYPADRALDEIDLPPNWVQRFQPVPNGYFLVHEDGHSTFMPRAEFEAGYATAAELIYRRTTLEQQLAHVNAAIAATEKS